MKILFSPAHYLYDNSQKGSEYQLTYDITNVLATKYPASIVVTGKSFIKNRTAYKINQLQPHVNINKITAVRAIIFTYRYTYETIRLLRSDAFDVLHHVRPFQLGRTFNLVALLGLHKDKPFFVGPFCSPYEHELKRYSIITPFSKVLEYLSKKTLQKASHIFVYDDNTKRNVIKTTSNHNVSVIPPGVDSKEFYPNKNISKTKFDVISVGYLIGRKQFDKLIRAFAILLKNIPDATLGIIGEGPEKDTLQALARDLGVEKHVKFLGFVPNSEIASYYRDSKVFASFQQEESFGQVYLEAMATGLPIVTTYNVGSSQIVKEDFGFLIRNENAGEFSSSMESILKDKRLRKRYSKNALTNYYKNYEKKMLLKKYQDIYTGLDVT